MGGARRLRTPWPVAYSRGTENRRNWTKSSVGRVAASAPFLAIVSIESCWQLSEIPLLKMENISRERGLGAASAFGGTGNNTNASAGSLNGNNSVANSNTNYAASFSLDYHDDFQLNESAPDSVVNKTEKIVTTADIQKAAGLVSRAVPEAERGNGFPGIQDLPFLEENGSARESACEHTENKKNMHFEKGISTLCRHKRLRNAKAFLLNKDVIRQAIHDAAEGKKVTPQLTWITRHVEETVDRIYHELSTETYAPKRYRFRTIRNKDEKPRHLAILGFYDRCVQQLLKNVIQEKLRALEPRNVYSNMIGRGTLSNDARYCLYAQLRHDFRVCGDGFALKLDIHHCYESISAEVVKRELFKYVTDAFTRRLVDKMFAHISYLPIGDPLSGLYVNLVLRKWHVYLLTKKRHLFHKCYFFCDDALFINRTSKAQLHELCHDSREWLLRYANLRVKKNYKVCRLSEGVTFCGARIFPEKILVRQLVKKRIIKAKDKPRALASYKGIIDKTSSAHLAKTLSMETVPDRVRDLSNREKWIRQARSAMSSPG